MASSTQRCDSAHGATFTLLNCCEKQIEWMLMILKKKKNLRPPCGTHTLLRSAEAGKEFCTGSWFACFRLPVFGRTWLWHQITSWCRKQRHVSSAASRVHQASTLSWLYRSQFLHGSHWLTPVCCCKSLPSSAGAYPKNKFRLWRLLSHLHSNTCQGSCASTLSWTLLDFSSYRSV